MDKILGTRNFEILLEEKTQFVPAKEILPSVVERISLLHNGGKPAGGIPIGFESLDDILLGLHKSDLIVVAAGPSTGKSAFVLDIAASAASKGRAVGIFSFEMDKEQLITRMIAGRASIPLWRIITGRLEGKKDFAKIERAAGDIAKEKIYVDETAGLDIMEVRERAHQLRKEHGLDILIIDYAQLVQPRCDAPDNPARLMEEVSCGLKLLAEELDIPVVAVSQLAPARGCHWPRLADLHASGSIDKYADVVLFLHRKDRAADATEEYQNVAEVIIAKHRGGPVGAVELKFNPELATFSNVKEKRLRSK